jgi:hypothetical protein
LFEEVREEFTKILKNEARGKKDVHGFYHPINLCLTGLSPRY